MTLEFIFLKLHPLESVDNLNNDVPSILYLVIITVYC